MSQIRVVLKSRRALPFFSGHPWVFAGAIARIINDADVPLDESTVPPGTEVELRTDKGEFVAWGLFNPHSNIRVRLYSWQHDQPVSTDLLRQRIVDAVACRDSHPTLNESTNSCRLIFSEADGLSGLTVDRYGEWLLVQFTSHALFTRRDEIVVLLNECLQPQGIWQRTERGMLENEALETADGLLSGDEPPRPFFIHENNSQFGVDLVSGHKTGWYLDQRDNRAVVASYAKNRRVLDLFCYFGGFAIQAGINGATSILGIDSSETAINGARANAELNEVAAKCRFEKSDVSKRMEELKTNGDQFDMVILDPPKMARTRSGIDRAMGGYFRFNRAAIDVLKPGGILVTCSCSGLVPAQNFEQMLTSVATDSGRTIRILEARGQAVDHPTSVSCFETNYLKCLICRVS